MEVVVQELQDFYQKNHFSSWKEIREASEAFLGKLYGLDSEEKDFMDRITALMDPLDEKVSRYMHFITLAVGCKILDHAQQPFPAENHTGRISDNDQIPRVLEMPLKAAQYVAAIADNVIGSVFAQDPATVPNFMGQVFGLTKVLKTEVPHMTVECLSELLGLDANPIRPDLKENILDVLSAAIVGHADKACLLLSSDAVRPC